MDKKQIIEFFDSCAPGWDEGMEIREDVILQILEKGGVAEGVKVLDVASGTGVLFPFYAQNKADVTGIDISSAMTEIAVKKHPQVKFFCGDAESFVFPEMYDVIMIHNAFPHFPDGEKLLKHLSSFLKEGGRLTVAHSMSEKELEECHSGAAKNVSLSLPCVEKMAEIMSAFLIVDVAISDEKMYIVSGKKR